jgi:hypothetical protein
MAAMKASVLSMLRSSSGTVVPVRTHSVKPDHRCHNRAVCSMAMRALSGEPAVRNRAATGALWNTAPSFRTSSSEASAWSSISVARGSVAAVAAACAAVAPL